MAVLFSHLWLDSESLDTVSSVSLFGGFRLGYVSQDEELCQEG